VVRSFSRLTSESDLYDRNPGFTFAPNQAVVS
jgi:hypothetical protein